MKHLILFPLLFLPVFICLGQDHPEAVMKRQSLQKLSEFVPSQAGDMYDVKHYELRLNANPDVYGISGTVTTLFQMLTESNTAGFDLYRNMIVDSIYYKGQRLNSYVFADDVIRITFPEALQEGEYGKVAISYHGEPQKEGFDAFSTASHGKYKILWTLSEPYGAYTWWPCKQTLTDKADSLDVIVTVPGDNRVASNGVLISEETTEINQAYYIQYHWKHRHPIATYLVAIAVTNYIELPSQVEIPGYDPIQLVDYAYPEEQTAWEASQTNTKQIMQFLCDIYGIYPYADEKYGHARFPYGGGMEHQTMSFVGSIEEALTVHELAHQWFGDYITCASWNDIWLNEGFATYSEGLYRERYFPNMFKTWRIYRNNNITSSGDGSVYRYSISDLYEIFDARLTYNKGAMVLHMLRKQVGDQAFFSGVRSYLQDPKLMNGFTTTDDFRKHIEQAADTSLVEFFNDWIYNQGYPIYRVGWQAGNTKSWIKITQTPSHASVDFFEMKVPVRFTATGKDTIVWVHNTENDQLFEINLGFRPAKVEFDPDFEIITKADNKVVEELIITGITNPVGKQTAIKQIQVYTLDGKRMTNSRLSSGIYLVKIISDDGTFHTERLIVQ